MDVYKQYIYELRLLALKEPYIQLLNYDIIPKCKEYIRKLNSITFDESSYHTYYGEIKNLVNSYNIYWTDVMDDAIKEADKCGHCINLAGLIEMTHETIEMQKYKQLDFESDFLPLNSTLEEQAYVKISDKYASCMKGMEEFQKNLKRLDKQDKVAAFAKEHFPISLKRKNDVFVFTYNFISYQLSLVVDQIRVSIEEIFNRVRNNARLMQEESELCVSNLLLCLYEKNKEHLKLSRQDIRASIEMAEVQHSMDIIKDKIKDSKQLPIQRLQEECKYWEDRLREFRQIHTSMKKLHEEEQRVIEEEELFNSMKEDAIPKAKQKCWTITSDKFKDKSQEISSLKLKAAKALQTFFSVRGPDRILYSDNIGRYYVDEYGHQCYVYNYGLSVYHVNCKGEFVDVPDKNKYFYDNMGRFCVDKDAQDKLYQIAPCSSSYRIENDVFVKHTLDCGHSEKNNKECRMLVKDPTDVVILPPIEHVDIKGKLEPETVKYLWDTFGHILPEVMYEVAEMQPKNPIHALAHKLLVNKYKRTEEDNKRMHNEADMYRNRINQDRLEKASATYKTWKKKQTRPRKPDEIDDSEEQFVFNAYVAKETFVKSLNNYNN